MKLTFVLSGILIFLISFNIYCQNAYVDIQKYTHHITISDNNDTIIGVSDIEILFNKSTDTFWLDLVNKNSEGKGMKVSKVTQNGKPLSFSQSNDKLYINFAATTGNNEAFLVHYSGVPASGLIISKNKYGDRTFFGDNWPNGARHWIPCIDHPSDKAYVTWKVTAPSHYQVIANGMLTEETDLDNESKLYVWESNVVLPTKVMVIGVSKFAVEYLGDVENIPLSSWVYPQNKEAGFYDFAQAKDILKYFITHIGPYPYEKLANVQSTTYWGGMENASNIFYPENSITGRREKEATVVHEIVHQWFGDSASEKDWPHLWLSEGFATYLTDIYYEDTYGHEVFVKRMESERQNVLEFAQMQYTPVVDYETEDYMQLINANSYSKGGWFLHMLRNKIGDENFWLGIRKYYETYKFSNATTDDFRMILEEVTGQNLQEFFNQWLLIAGHPELAIKKSIIGKELNLSITQNQKSKHTFTFPLEVKLTYSNGSEEIKVLEIEERKEEFQLSLSGKLKNMVFDPNTRLLFNKTIH